MHRHKRKGVRSLHLKEDAVTGLSKFDSDRTDFKKWDITAKNVQLPNDDHTHYYCQVCSLLHPTNSKLDYSLVPNVTHVWLIWHMWFNKPM